MLKKNYTVVDCLGDSCTNVNMFEVIKERLKTKNLENSYTLKILYNGDILNDFGVEFVYSKKEYFGIHYKGSSSELSDVYVNCRYIIEDGLGNIINPNSLIQKYIQNRPNLAKKVDAAVNETFPFCRSSYGIKKYKRRVKGSYYRKPRKSSLMNELKSLEYSLEFDVNVRKKRVQEITWVTQEGSCRTTKKSWKNYKLKKQWMKGV